MRPRVLDITAFGPFAKQESVDFRRLVGHDLLLIEGPTGAGKTSILDAMTYALFGTVPGARHDAEDALRSDHSDPRVLCEVKFEFEVGEKIYRVHRVPAQERAKVRGTGRTRQAAEAHLYEVRDEGGGPREWPVCAPKIPDVDAAVKQLLGLSVEQFKQVILLPQGDFRQFLLARSAEKEPLLEQLFGTSLYKQVAIELADERKALEKRAETAAQAQVELLGQRGATSLAALDAGLVQGAAEVAAAEEDAAVAGRRAAADQAAHTAAAHVAARFAALDRARAAAVELARAAERAAALRARLERAERAEPLRARFQRAGEEGARRDRLAQAADEQTAARGAAAAALAAREAEAAALPARRARLEELVVRDGALAALAGVETTARELTRKFDEAEQARKAEADGVRKQRDALRRGAKELAAVEAELARMRGDTVDVGAVVEAAARARSEAVRREELATAEAAVARGRTRAAEAGAVVGELAQALARAQDEVGRRRTAREAGLAAELAEGLAAGKPCPVCGAHEHPAPAPRAAMRVSADDVTNALASEARAAQQLARGQSSHARLDAEAGAAAQQAQALRDALGAVAAEAFADVAARADARAVIATAARAAATRLRELETAESARRRALAEGEAAAQKAEASVLRLQQQAEDARIRKEEQDAQLRARLGAGETVATARTALARERELLLKEIAAREQALRHAQATLAAADAACAAARVAADEQAVVARDAAEAAASEARLAGFVDDAEACLALLAPEEAKELRGRGEDFARRDAEVRQTVRDVERELDGLPRPDEPALAAAARTATTAAAAAQERLGAARTALAELKKARDAVAARAAEYDQIDARLRLTGKLARVVGGENALRMSLQRFVLAARMEEVAVAASERLALMSRGRYRLRRTDQVKHGGRGSGLDLVVEDAHTGVERAVHSLSGGEMFLASLSLAMGLADVVQSHAGGIRLQSLFIDEGFGSLDDETLDQVMRTLEDLRAGGRLVGLISHVAELKERLPTRLTVHKSARGSWTELVV